MDPMKYSAMHGQRITYALETVPYHLPGAVDAALVPHTIKSALYNARISLNDALQFTKDDYTHRGVALGHRVKLMHFRDYMYTYEHYWRLDTYVRLTKQSIW